MRNDRKGWPGLGMRDRKRENVKIHALQLCVQVVHKVWLIMILGILGAVGIGFIPGFGRGHYILFGGLGTALLTTFVISLRYLICLSIKVPDDVEKYLGMATLGIIPCEDNKNKQLK